MVKKKTLKNLCPLRYGLSQVKRNGLTLNLMCRKNNRQKEKKETDGEQGLRDLSLQDEGHCNYSSNILTVFPRNKGESGDIKQRLFSQPN